MEISSSSVTVIRPSIHVIRIGGGPSTTGRQPFGQRASCTSLATSSVTTTRSPSPAGAWDGRGTTCRLGYGAAVGALQYNENQVEVVVGPAMTAGASAILTTSTVWQRHIRRKQRHNLLARKRDEDRRSTDRRHDLSRCSRTDRTWTPSPLRCWLPSKIRRGCTSMPFAKRSGRHGIESAGQMVDVDQLPDATQLRRGHRTHHRPISATLEEIIDVAMKWSRNGYAETCSMLCRLPANPRPPTKGSRCCERH